MCKAVVLTGESAGCLRTCADNSWRSLKRAARKGSVMRRPLRSVTPREVEDASLALVPGGEIRGVHGMDVRICPSCCDAASILRLRGWSVVAEYTWGSVEEPSPART